MSEFSDNFRAWLEEQRREESLPLAVKQMRPQHICLHCKNPFPRGAGVVTEHGALCDVCND